MNFPRRLIDFVRLRSGFNFACWTFCLAGAAGFGAGSSLAADHGAKLKVLLVTGGHPFEAKPFYDVYRENPDITFASATQGPTNADAYERPDFYGYDVVVLYDIVRTITEPQKARFLAMFDKGMGLVVMHHSIVSYQHWPEYERIIGGKYPEEDGKAGFVTPLIGYQHDVEMPIKILAHDHPITMGMKDFTIQDEIYWGFRIQSDVTPLITTTQPKSGKPLCWCRTEGKSRVVYLQLGHGPSAYNDPNYRHLVARSIAWAGKRLN